MSTGFTMRPLVWHPHIAPLEMEDASPAQLEAMQVTPSGGKVSPYVRTLAHDPESYAARTKLYNLVMYAKGGLANEWRELGALVASRVNGCVYCASVHAKRHMQITGEDTVVKELYLKGLDGDFDAKTRAVIDFCRDLSATPSTATADQVATLRDLGFSDDDISDLVHSAAMFGWANRLMHTLGHAVPSDKK